eukprot:scaffold162611_cov33-Tisochrysis_lutea.AAC.2
MLPRRYENTWTGSGRGGETGNPERPSIAHRNSNPPHLRIALAISEEISNRWEWSSFRYHQFTMLVGDVALHVPAGHKIGQHAPTGGESMGEAR